MQTVLFVLLVPVTIVVFNGFSILSGVVNLIAVPWVSFITVPVSLLAAVLNFFDWPTAWLFSIADGSLAMLFSLIEQPWAKSGWVTVQYMPWYGWALLVVFMLSWLVGASKSIRAMSFMLVIPPLMFMLQPYYLNEGTVVKVDILDVGQGLAVVIEKNHQVMVYDLGPRYRSGFNTAESVVLPFLAYHGHSHVDTLVLSHSDSDHAGAYDKFLAKMPTDKIIAPLKILPDATACAVDNFDWLGLKVELLWPIDGVTLPVSSNDSSCVLKISHRQFSVLLTGDISKRVEKQLVKHYGARLVSTILIAPHHGSNSSSSPTFVNAVNPEYVVYSAGFLNRYKFPRKEVVARYDQIKAQQLNTAEVGQISFRLTDGKLELKQARQDLLPNWYYNQ